MPRSEIERSRALQRGFLVVANSLAALAAFCTVVISTFLLAIFAENSLELETIVVPQVKKYYPIWS